MAMTKDEYKRALDAACREYEALSQQRADLDKRLSELHETIGALTRLCGYTPTVPWGLTDAVRIVLMRAEKPMSATDVRERLQVIGFDASKYTSILSAIHTILKRLYKAGDTRFVAREAGNHAYQWVRGHSVAFDQPHAHVPFEVLNPSPAKRRKK
jgi:hypothetical protein